MDDSGGNTLPRIERAEHIGQNTGDNIEAKKVADFEFEPGSMSWQRAGVGYGNILFDPDDVTPSYMGLNVDFEALTSASTWIIYKFTYGGAGKTQIQKTTGIWDDRASYF